MKKNLSKGVKYNKGKPKMNLVPPGFFRLEGGVDSLIASWFYEDGGSLHEAGHELMKLFPCKSAATEAVCKVMEFGAEKYDSYNWYKGLLFSDLVASALRHAQRIGELDEESGLPHEAHALCCVTMLITFINDIETFAEFDDRPRRCE